MGLGGRCHLCNSVVPGVPKDGLYTCSRCRGTAPPEPSRGRVICGDALEEMRRLPSRSFGSIITSPPYNVCRTVDDRKNSSKPQVGSTFAYFHPGYDGYDDARPHAEYVSWQQECLREMYRLIRPDGCAFYNHRYRHQQGPMDHLQWIHDCVPVRQIVVWNRKQNLNTNPSYMNPIHENIYLIAGTEWKRATNRARATCDGKAGAVNMTSIWTTNYATHEYGHPAPFPVELPLQCLAVMRNPGPVLDPFMGSGSVAVAAEQLGLEWTGIEQSPNYCNTIRARVAREGRAGQRRIL